MRQKNESAEERERSEASTQGECAANGPLHTLTHAKLRKYVNGTAWVQRLDWCGDS